MPNLPHEDKRLTSRLQKLMSQRNGLDKAPPALKEKSRPRKITIHQLQISAERRQEALEERQRKSSQVLERV
jgi:hypothetical protein